MKFISINGSTCSGKSSVIKSLLAQRDHLFSLSYDAIKWSFSKYAPDTHFDDVHQVMLSMLVPLSGMEYDVISDSGLRKDWREMLLDTARERGYDVVEINFEAEHDVLAKRFDERIQSASARPDIPIMNRSKKRFEELYKMFQEGKNPEALTFRTDQQSIEGISEQILKFF
jgi:predicted ABC-type ATPase